MRIQKFTALKKRFSKDERGTTAVVFSLMAVPMVAMVGMALDYGRANDQVERMQSAIDSAVLAAANVPVADKAATAQAYFEANFNKQIAGASTQFNIDNAGNITGVATSTIAMPFASLAQLRSVEVDVNASATNDVTSTTTNVVTTTTTTAGNIPCIHVMDPNANKALWMDSLSSYSAPGCVVNVLSNHSQAMYNVSASNTKFKSIKVKGGAQAGSGLTIVDAPNIVQTNQAVQGDPYYKAVDDIAKQINPGSCTAANTNKTWTGTVNPGTYCGATVFSGATFKTGLYIIASGSGAGQDGRLSFTGMINGNSGVSFYLADNKSQLQSYSGSEGSKLAAPTSGLTKGLLFFEKSNRGGSYAFSVANQSKHSWTGLFYMPSVNLTLDSLSSWNVFNVAIAVNQLKMKSLSSVMTAYAWTPYNETQPITLAGSTVTTQHNQTTSHRQDGYLDH